MQVDIAELLRAGQLDEAIAGLNAQVRASPTDVDLRANLVELLCFAGNLERADVLLDAITNLDPSRAVGSALYRQLVRAEQARRQFYEDGRVPEFLAKPDPVSELEMRAAVLLRNGDAKAAGAVIEERDSLRAAVAGTCNGEAFDDFRDLDDVSAGHLEVLTPNGKYYWVPVTAVSRIEFRKPERRRDLIWRRAYLSMFDHPDGEIFLPAIYCAANMAPAERLGHVTDFDGADGEPAQGRGLRSFLVGDDARTILELSDVTFAAAGG